MNAKTEQTEKTTVPAVYSAVAAVQAAMAKKGVGKDSKNQQQGFKYRSWDAVQQALSAELAENKLMIIPHINTRDETVRQTKQGGLLYSVVLTGNIVFLSTADNSSFEFPAVGEAMDSGDKATAKAITAMVKYSLLHALCIPLQGSPDSDADTPPETVEKIISDDQTANLDALIDEVKADRDAFLQYFKIEKLDDMKEANYPKAVKLLEGKRT